jgi:hypothetical protein
MSATVVCARCSAAETAQVHAQDNGYAQMNVVHLPPGWGHYVIQKYDGYNPRTTGRASGDTLDLCARCAATATIGELTARYHAPEPVRVTPPWVV